MLPVQVEFPKFVADQLLTSQDLNQLFGYLDEQNRMTRTNLIGIGIVCGLHLQLNNSKTQVTITKGCAVTSEGYLISANTQAYTQYKKYKVDTARMYEKFYKLDGGGNKIAMDVWELKQPAIDPDLQSIDADFLKDKVILLFVELKEEDNKNCDPNSCDDKGINVTVSFLPMAVSVDDAKLLMGTGGIGFGVNTYTALPEIRMKRWDVPNTTPVYSQDIFEAYLKLLDKPFIDSVETTLKNIYSVFGPVVANEYASNPFTGLSAKFDYLYNGNINLSQLLHLQYYYDLFSDLLLAYQEFRKAGTHVLSTCCPDSDLFPRHVLLGEAIPSVTSGILPFRHYFIYSPLFDQQGMVGELKSLFKRLVLLIDQFFIPTVTGNNTKDDSFLRITPSMLWDVPLSHKAIPYYYQVNSGAQPLYLSWDHRRTLLNDAKRNLSYHAIQYNPSDEFVTSPLKYDLEPYNFLRVEGIVGKSYVHVLKQVKQQIQKNRLPVDIIALSSDTGAGFNTQLNSFNRFEGSKDALEMLCHFQDLESMYDSMRREILCMLCKELKYYYDFTFPMVNAFLRKMTLAGEVSQVDLFDVCSKGYVIKDKSLGMMIEFLHRKGLTDETLTLETFFEAFGVNVQDTNNDDIPDNLTGQMSTIYLALLNFFKIPLGIIRLSTLLTEDLAEFDVKAYCSATEKLGEYAKSLKALFSIFTGSQQSKTSDGANEVNPDAQPGVNTDEVNRSNNINRVLINNKSSNSLAMLASSNNGFVVILRLLLMVEDLMDHFDVLIYNCKCSALLSLKKDYMKRYLMLTRLRQFGYFTKLHPGIQHKAGVPMGGTFIIVYHSRKKRAGGVILNSGTEINEVTGERNSDDHRMMNTNDAVERETIAAGFILDEDANPVAGAVISVAETGESTVTATNGSFTFSSSIVPYTLVVEAVGYELYEEIKTDGHSNMRVILKEANQNMLDELQQGVVIADFYLPYRCCSDCPPIQYIVQDKISTDVPNKGPVVNAGPDQIVTLVRSEVTRPTAAVTLTGSASDPDGNIVSFLWIKKSGPALPLQSILTESSAQTAVKNLLEGVYVFELTVTDNHGSIARDEVQVTVNPAPPPENKPPIAKATATLFAGAANAIKLDGSGSTDEDGTIDSHKWIQLDGVTVTIDGATLETAIVKDMQPGTYKFQLIVTDNNSATGTADVSITIEAPPNLPPIANAGPNQVVTISPNESIKLDGSASKDPENGLLIYEWTVVPGSANNPNILASSQSITDVTGLVTGDYKFQLKVTDDKNLSDVATVAVQVIVREVVIRKTCGPLKDIIKLFDEFEAVDARNFPGFINADGFNSYGIVKEYFAKMQGIVSSSANKQIDFFASPFNGATVQELLKGWLNALQKLIVERKDLRLLALTLYRILHLLVMYIVCIQKEDVDTAKIAMQDIISIIHKHISKWVNMISTREITAAPEINIIKRIADDIEKELKRVETNGEAETKVKYKTMLLQVLELLENIS